MSDSLADILANLWATEHYDEFEKLIAQVKDPREQSNYSSKSNEELIISAGILRICKWEVVIRIILNTLNLPWEKAYRLSNEITANFGPSSLAWLYFHHSDEALLRFYVGVHLELADLSREMVRRTGQREIRRAVLRFQEEDVSSIKTLLGAIEQQAKKWGTRKPFLPFGRHDETTDRKQTALLKIQEAYVKMGALGLEQIKSRFSVPIPRISAVPLGRKKETALAQVRLAILQADIVEMANTLLPILNGETLPQMAYNSFSGEDEKIKAQRRNIIIDFDLQTQLKEYSRGNRTDNSLREALLQREFSRHEADAAIAKLKGAKNRKRLGEIIEEIIQDAQKRTTSIEKDSIKSPDRIMIERHFGVWKKDEARLEILGEMGLMKAKDESSPISLSVHRAIKRVIESRRTPKSKAAARIFLEELKVNGDKTRAMKAANLNRHTRNQILLELQRELNPPDRKK